MIEIVWQFDPASQEREPQPATAGEALSLLTAGNRDFADLLNQVNTAQGGRRVIEIFPDDLGIARSPGEAPMQKPFAAVLSCADARVPTELVFSQASNDLFAVRVAGNVLAPACLGSLDYAANNLDSVKLLVVLGHTGCGAVTAAVESLESHAKYLDVAVNQPLRVIVDSLIPLVTSSNYALIDEYGADVRESPGYRGALIEMAVSMNAAMIAGIIARTYAAVANDDLGVVYGVYNLGNRLVGRPAGESFPGFWEPGLFNPPGDDDGFLRLSEELAGSNFIRNLLLEEAA